MLSKLIKYDIRSTWRDFAGVYLAILLGVFILPLIVKNYDNAIISAVAGLYAVGIVIATIVVMIVTLFKIFNSSVFSKTGYLTMTLPVTSTQIVASKLLVSSMWIVLTGIVSAAGICIFIWNVAPLADVIPLLKKALSLIGSNEVFAIVLMVIAMVASTVKEIAKLFLACSIAHLRRLGRFRVLVGILSYFVLSWLEALILKALGFVADHLPGISGFINDIDIHFDMMTGPQDILQFTGLFNGAMTIGILYALALIAAYSIGIIWILNRKLDLD